MLLSNASKILAGFMAAVLLSTVACGRRNEDVAPVGGIAANQCPQFMGGYVNPALYPNCQPSNPLYNNGYPNAGWNANLNGQFNAGWNTQWNGYYNTVPYYYSNMFGNNCWNYNGMYYGFRISGGETLWKAYPMSKDQVEALAKKECEFAVTAHVDVKGLLQVKSDKDQKVIFIQEKVEGVAQTCDQVRYSKEGVLYQFDAATGKSFEVPSSSVSEPAQE